MKNYKHIASLVALFLSMVTSWANEGNPYVVNFSSDQYKGHTRNFDIIADDEGNVLVANFEGLLYWDGVQFSMLHTPGISRITCLAKDHKGQIWFGGYNVFGRVEIDARGQMSLNNLISKKEREGRSAEHGAIGEVVELIVGGDNIELETLSDHIYQWNGQDLVLIDSIGGDVALPPSLDLPTGERVIAIQNGGIRCVDANGHTVFTMNHQNGLCNDNVNQLAYSNGRIWGATDNGIFCISYPSALSHYTMSEGIVGEVLSMGQWGNDLYVGTTQGLYVRSDEEFRPIADAEGACWQLHAAADGLYAATSTGLKRVVGQKVTPISQQHTLAVLPLGNGKCLAGELKGAVLYDGGQSTQLSERENITKLCEGSDGTLFIQDIYGGVAYRASDMQDFEPINGGAELPDDAVLNMYKDEQGIKIITSSIIYAWRADERRFVPIDTLSSAFDYPRLIYTDANGYVWMSDSRGRGVTAFDNGEIDHSYTPWLQPLAEVQVGAMLVSGKKVYFGNKDGVVCWNQEAPDPLFRMEPKVYVRDIRLGADSVLWARHSSPFTLHPSLFTLHSSTFTLTISYSTACLPVGSEVKYRYRLSEDAPWGGWTTHTQTQLINLPAGHYTFEVQAMDCYGRLSPSESVSFDVPHPWFLRWWSILIYILLSTFVTWLFLKARTQRLLRDKLRLEALVEERTADLRQAQNSLVRQERMATVGKMTKGLIDRILNPINYINNFAHLSEGLVNDLESDAEEERTNIDSEIYDDMTDLTGMIKGNLAKIVDHGTNASRILKAMEAMLNQRVGTLVPIDLADVCRTAIEVARSRQQQEVSELGIKIEAEGCDVPTPIMGDASMLSKCLVSMLDNSIYAIRRKLENGTQNGYEPKIQIIIDRTEKGKVKVKLRDNGIGIEEGIKEEVFAPFFTTKTTKEGAGVGLYLTKETIQAHDGDIDVESVKGEYTQFNITLNTTA